MSTETTSLKKIVDSLNLSPFGFKELDLSNRDYANSIIEQFGGQNHLEKSFPKLNAVIMNTLKNPIKVQEENSIGFCDRAVVLDIGYDQKTSSIYSIGTMTLTKPALRLFMTIELYEAGKIIARAKKVFEACEEAEILIKASKRPTLERGRKYQVYVHVLWEPWGEKRLRSMVAETVAEACGEDLIESFNIVHPRHIRTPLNSPIVVIYSRTAAVEVYDYNYSETRDKETGDEMVMLDVEGKLLLKNNYHVSSVESAFLALDCIGFGDIIYNRDIIYGQQGQEGVSIFPIENNTGIGWKINNVWNTKIPSSVKFGDRFHNFEFHFAYRCAEDMLLHWVLITSKKIPIFEEQPHVKTISQIRLYWGCLAKDTEIEMADGSRKRICNIQLGDYIRTSQGRGTRVTNIYTGREEKIYVVHMLNDYEVRASRNHPLKGEKDFVSVIDIDSKTQLMTLDGISLVQYCYEQDYDDQVYSLELADADSFYANGIVSGTNTVQNSINPSANKELYDQSREIAEELKRISEDFAAGIV